MNRNHHHWWSCISSCYDMSDIKCQESIKHQGFITGLMKYLSTTPNADYNCITEVRTLTYLYHRAYNFQSTCSVMKFCAQYQQSRTILDCYNRESTISRYQKCDFPQNTEGVNCHYCNDCTILETSNSTECWTTQNDCCYSLDGCWYKVQGQKVF